MPTPSRVRWIPVARISPVAVSCLTILTLKYSYHEQRSFQTSRSGTGGPCDIAPTYAEYVQLAFAIATDCGEAGRSDFISLCEPSPKFNALHANKLFSSALRTGNQNVHLGTAFHLAKLAGVEIGFKFQGFTKPFSSHTRVSTYNTADTVDQAHETSDRETEANDAPLHIAVSLTPPCTAGTRLSMALVATGHPRFRQ